MRVSDSDPEMLRYLAGRGISPGDRFAVRERQPFGGPLFVRFGEREHAIGGELAGAMRVEVEQTPQKHRARIRREPGDGHATEAAAVPRPRPAAADRGGHRSVSGSLARSSRSQAQQALVSAVAARGPRDPRHARGERRAEHDRLRRRRRAVRARVLRAVHPGPVRDGLRLPGDVHARRRGHPPWLWRAGPAALRPASGAGSAPAISPSPTWSPSSPSSSRSASGWPTSTSAPAWPSCSGSALVAFTLSGGRYWRWERIVLGLALFNGLFLAGGDPGQTPRRSDRRLV